MPQETLRARLPNKVTPASLMLTAILAGGVWYILATTEGRGRILSFFVLLLALLVFETIFLLFLRFIRSNAIAVVLAAILSGLSFAWQLAEPSFVLKNALIITAAVGAPAFIIHMGYLRTRFLFLVAALWTLYDVLSVRYIIPKIFVPAATPTPSLLFPALTVGNVTLGSGDVVFLVIFALVLLRDFGRRPAVVLIACEAVGLLVAGAYRLQHPLTPVPFLVVMTPLFFLVYAVAWKNRRTGTRQELPV